MFLICHVSFQHCPTPNCTLRNSLHAHCALNCYREIRDTPVEKIEQFLEVCLIDQSMIIVTLDLF